MTQLRTVWFHMRTNMSFGDEERSFFIMSSMYRLFTVSNYTLNSSLYCTLWDDFIDTYVAVSRKHPFFSCKIC